jgi:outer membrane protein assembly factor BamB
MKRIALLCAAIAVLTGSVAVAAGTYSAGGWSPLHQDSGKRRYVDVDTVSLDYRVWQALAGATVLTAPTTSPDGRQIYVTTGMTKGHSNLHAFSIDGELLWQSDPWQSADEGVDPCAFLSSPIVDEAGDLFVSDCNQLFAFTFDGEVKWKTALPSIQSGDWMAAGTHPVNAFTTAVFTRDGHLLGVTNFGDVVVVDRTTGEVINQAYRLRGVLPPYAETVSMPASVFANDFMDSDFREWAWQLIFGGSMRSANTPAVAQSGRVYVVGSSVQKGFGSLYALDLSASDTGVLVEESFVTDIGLGSGSSPTLSPDEDRVYVSDGGGWLYSIDAVSGAIVWKVKTSATAGAAAVGGDGVIYALQAYAPALVAVDPQGTVLWESDFSLLAHEQLPVSLFLGDPVATGNGNPTVTGDAVLVPVVYGYQIPMTDITVPVRSVVAAVDLKTGEAMTDVVSLPGDSSGITAVLQDGTLVSSIGDATTSAVSPLKPIMDLLLPKNLTVMDATGGIQVAIPVKN